MKYEIAELFVSCMSDMSGNLPVTQYLCERQNINKEAADKYD